MSNPVPLETDVDRVVAAYRDAAPRADVRSVVEISSQTYSMLRAGETADNLIDLVRAFASVQGDPKTFARWATRRRNIRAWWTPD